MADRLSCPSTSGIFPDQKSNPCSLHWQILNQWITREVVIIVVNGFCFKARFFLQNSPFYSLCIKSSVHIHMPITSWDHFYHVFSLFSFHHLFPLPFFLTRSVHFRVLSTLFFNFVHYFFFWLHCVPNLSSPARLWACAPSVEAQSPSPDHQGSPCSLVFLFCFFLVYQFSVRVSHHFSSSHTHRRTFLF